MRAPWNIRVGLALGGGAARGLAHAGVIRALVREGIPIDVIAGTSMGSIIGAAYAVTDDVDLLLGRIRETLTSERFKKSRLSFLKESKERRGSLLYSVANLVKRGIVYGVSNWKRSFLSAEAFASDIESIVPDVEVEDTRIPFGAVTLDLEEGEEVVLCHGSLRRAVAASSAIPGVLPPVHLGGRVLIDGGWIDKVPVLPAFRLGADVVIAVDISADIYDTRDYRKGVEILLRANAIKDAALVAFTRTLASVVVEPDVKDVHWADFGQFERCVEAGDAAATAAVPAIREAIRVARLRSFVRPSVGKRLAEQHLESDNMNFSIE
jgi:NTE family protein